MAEAPAAAGGHREVLRALASLSYPPESGHARLAALLGLPDVPSREEHTRMFLFAVHPYASVYLSADGMQGGEVRDRIDGFWRAVGREPAPESDHLGALLSLACAIEEAGEVDDAAGTDAEAVSELRRHGARALRLQYVDSWVYPFLDAVARAASKDFFSAWAGLLRLTLEATAPVGSIVDPLPDVDLPDPDAEGVEALARALLAPGRSGLVLTRQDLLRRAKVAGLRVRPERRAYMLETLLRQDPSGTLEWLQGEAWWWRARHETRAAQPGSAASAWVARAERTAALAAGLSASLTPARAFR